MTHGANALMHQGERAAGCDIRCGTCGSLLWSVVRNRDWRHVCNGTLRDTPSLAPTEHIFVGSKAAWELIWDALPQRPET